MTNRPPRDESRAAGRRAALALLLGAAVLAPSCATNPATGQRQLMLVSEAQEIAMGRESDAEIVRAYGLYPDPEVQDYVSRLGLAMAARSERPDLPWTFRVLDDPVVNAFALPGGFIYVTRGIMAHLTSEAQLMGVVGHEIGHVTARHSAAQMSKAQLATVGLGVGMIAAPDLAEQFGGLAQGAVGLLFLRFGRDAERQADDLGLRYLERMGYEPSEISRVFQVLQRVGEQGASDRLPSWLSTHPDPEERVRRASARLPAAGEAGGRVEREAYLQQLDGMVFGPNPREGLFRDSVFYHPELRFRIDFPRGWKAQNEKQSVTAVSPAQDAVVGLALAEGSPEQAARSFLARLSSTGARRTEVNGLPAVQADFQATTQQGVLRGQVVFVAYEGRTYGLLAYAAGARWSAYERAAETALRSFRPLTERRWLDAQPRRISLVRLGGDTTIAEFAERYPSTVPVDTLALINHAAGDAPLPVGVPIKRVTGGPPK